MDQPDAIGRDDLLGPASGARPIGEYVGRIDIQSKNRPSFVISHIHRRGRLPNNVADGEGDIERDSFKTLLAQSGPKARGRAYDEASDQGDPERFRYQAYQNAGGFSAPASRRSPIT